MELYNTGKLPNLKKLINNGGKIRDIQIDTSNCHCSGDGDNYHTETGPGHAAMLSGYGFPTTKNHANYLYNKSAPTPAPTNPYEQDPYAYARGEILENDCPQICPNSNDYQCFLQLGPNPIPLGLTIFERLKKANSNIKTGMITGKDHEFFPFPAFKNAAPPTCCRRHKATVSLPSTSSFTPIASVSFDCSNSSARGFKENCCGVNTTATALNTCQNDDTSQSTVNSRAITFLGNNKNNDFFLFVHYREPDRSGHDASGKPTPGENSTIYNQGIIDDDYYTGKLINKLIDLGIYEKTTIIVTTDHGFQEGTKQHHTCQADTKDIWAVTNKANVLGNEAVVGKQTSITPTILDLFNVDLNNRGIIDPPFTNESLFVEVATTPSPSPTPSPNSVTLNRYKCRGYEGVSPAPNFYFITGSQPIQQFLGEGQTSEKAQQWISKCSAEGIAGYGYDIKVPGTIPLYAQRCHMTDDSNGQPMYDASNTTNLSEIETATTPLPLGWGQCKGSSAGGDINKGLKTLNNGQPIAYIYPNPAGSPNPGTIRLFRKVTNALGSLLNSRYHLVNTKDGNEIIDGYTYRYKRTILGTISESAQ